MTTGSLGQGISVATGIAYGQIINDSPHFTYTIVGDGELNEGQCWEAIQFAAHHKLRNLIVFVDDNKNNLMGRQRRSAILVTLLRSLKPLDLKHFM